MNQKETASINTEPESQQPEEKELCFLRERNRAEDWRHWRVDAAISGAIHLVVVVILLLIPDTPVVPVEEPPHVIRHITPLYIPRDLTQKAPNKGKIQKELTVEAIAPHPFVRVPSPAPAARPSPSAGAVIPAPQQARLEAPPLPQPVVVEPQDTGRYPGDLRAHRAGCAAAFRRASEACHAGGFSAAHAAQPCAG